MRLVGQGSFWLKMFCRTELQNSVAHFQTFNLEALIEEKERKEERRTTKVFSNFVTKISKSRFLRDLKSHFNEFPAVLVLFLYMCLQLLKTATLPSLILHRKWNMFLTWLGGSHRSKQCTPSPSQLWGRIVSVEHLSCRKWWSNTETRQTSNTFSESYVSHELTTFPEPCSGAMIFSWKQTRVGRIKS